MAENWESGFYCAACAEDPCRCPEGGANRPTCELCGEPMPEGEEMFKYHGYSCDCPKPPLPRPVVEDPKDAEIARLQRELAEVKARGAHQRTREDA